MLAFMVVCTSVHTSVSCGEQLNKLRVECFRLCVLTPHDQKCERRSTFPNAIEVVTKFTTQSINRITETTTTTNNTTTTMIRNMFKSKVNPNVATETQARKTPSPAHENAPVQETVENHLTPVPVLGEIDHDSQVKLGIEKHLFSHIGDSVPILSTTSGEPFRGLEIRGDVFQHGDVVLERADTHTPVGVIERKYAVADNTFTIYTTRPAYSGEKPASIFKYNTKLYRFAEVKHDGKVWDVVLDGQTKPTYTMHKLLPAHAYVPQRRHFPTKHSVRNEEGNEVACMRYSEGEGAHSFVLVVNAGVDATLMILLAIIADEVDK